MTFKVNNRKLPWRSTPLERVSTHRVHGRKYSSVRGLITLPPSSEKSTCSSRRRQALACYIHCFKPPDTRCYCTPGPAAFSSSVQKLLYLWIGQRSNCLLWERNPIYGHEKFFVHRVACVWTTFAAPHTNYAWLVVVQRRPYRPCSQVCVT